MKGNVSIVRTNGKTRKVYSGGMPSMECVLTVREKSNSLLDVACKS